MLASELIVKWNFNMRAHLVALTPNGSQMLPYWTNEHAGETPALPGPLCTLDQS